MKLPCVTCYHELAVRRVPMHFAGRGDHFGHRDAAVLARGAEIRRRCVSKQLDTGTAAPGFHLVDTSNRSVRLSDYQGDKHVVLVFNRGFM